MRRTFPQVRQETRGGACTKWSLLNPQVERKSDAVVPGWALVNSWVMEDTELYVANVHFFGFAKLQKQKLFKTSRDIKHLAEQNPLKVILFLAGDFNFPAIGESNAHML
jgi:hypothetical protein